MFARITTVQIQPGAADELTQYLTERVVPAARQAHGFGGIQILVNPATNTGMAITFWESEADMAAGEGSLGYYPPGACRSRTVFGWATQARSIRGENQSVKGSPYY
jgi:hypothetical protein